MEEPLARGREHELKDDCRPATRPGGRPPQREAGLFLPMPPADVPEQVVAGLPVDGLGENGVEGHNCFQNRRMCLVM